MSRPAFNKLSSKSSRFSLLNGLQSSSWFNAISGTAIMVLAQQALAKMQEKGLTPEVLLNSLDSISRETSSAVALPQATALSDKADLQATDALMAEIAELALAMQKDLPSQDAEFADMLVPALLESMGLNFALIQEATDRVVLAQASTNMATVTDAGGAAGAAPAGAATVLGANAVTVGLAVLGALALSSLGSSSTPVVATPDTIAPTVNSVALSNSTGALANTLNAGDVVYATITMSEATTVTGTPKLALNIGGTGVQASYVSGSGSTALVFSYTILASQADANGISIAANSLMLNGGTLADAAGNAATITHSLVAGGRVRRNPHHYGARLGHHTERQQRCPQSGR